MTHIDGTPDDRNGWGVAVYLGDTPMTADQVDALVAALGVANKRARA